MDEHIKNLTQVEFERSAPLLEQLYRQHAAAIFAYVCLHIAAREEAEDLLLEVFLAAIQFPALLERNATTQGAWLRRVAQHKIVDYYRQANHRQTVPLEHIPETCFVDEALSPEQMALQREGDADILAALCQLPVLQQQVIHLHFVYGLRSAEIAGILNKQATAVRKLLSRAVNAIRTLYLENKEKQPS
jgi:RNA polymerase sigma factor (sigma-70 family)